MNERTVSTPPAVQLLRATHAVVGRLAPQVAAERARERFMTPRRWARPWEKDIEASGARQTLANGLSVLGFERGTPKVLAIHGWEGKAAQWGALNEVLRDRGASLYALDGPAHGHSPGDRAHPVAFAEALLAADRELGPFDAVIGHSMGAAAAAVAISWGLRTRRAVMVAGPASLTGVLQRFSEYVGLPVPAQAKFIEAIETRVGVPVDRLAIDEIAAKLELPGLIVHDRNDREVPFQEADAVVKAWPDAQLIATDGLGHRRILRDRPTLEHIADFVVEA